MNNKMQLAVAHAINDARIAADRQRSAYGVGVPAGFVEGPADQKRARAWCEYGFPSSITYDMLYSLYRRGGVANGAVNKIANTCWKTNPWIVEGGKDENATKNTAWEDKTNAKVLAEDGVLWAAFREADKRRLVGRYSALLLRIADDGQLSNSILKKGAALVEVLPVWAGALSVVSKDAAGKTTMWGYTERTGQTVNVHPNRLFILGDPSDQALGFLDPAYNACVSLEKIEGGSGETYLKNASRALNLNFDKDVKLGDIAKMYGVDIKELQGEFNKAAQELNAGNDLLMVTQGASVTPLVANAPLPSEFYDVNLRTACATWEIPARELVGSQSGERASSEDRKQLLARCQSRRVDLSPEIKAFLKFLERIGVLEPLPKFEVVWDDLTTPTLDERLSNAGKLVDMNQKFASEGQEAPFTMAEVRTLAGFAAEKPADSPKPMGETE